MTGAPKLCKEQPGSFHFSEKYLSLAQTYISRYPDGHQRSAVLPLLYLAQEQEGWVSRPAIEVIAQMLNIPPIKVLEVASFYTMFHLSPVGRYHLQVCTTTPCWLRGSDALMEKCKSKLGISPGETTEDGQFTLTQVECIGACVNAPVVQINNDFYEDLIPERLDEILEALVKGQTVKPGPQVDRQTSAPQGGPTTLQE